MRRGDIWLLILTGMIFAGAMACFPEGHDDIPDKAEVTPESSPNELEISPTPDRCAYEYEVDSLRDSLDSCREQVRRLCEPQPDDD